MEESRVARKTDDPSGVKKVAKSMTFHPALLERVTNLEARTGLSASVIVAAALSQRIEAFEDDPGEILRSGASSPRLSKEGGEE